MIEKEENRRKISEEELQALRNYMGYKHTQINFLTDMESNALKELEKNWSFSSDKEVIEELINEFVHIYSIIYRYGDVEERRGILRGTATAEAKQMQSNGETRKFLSITNKEINAKRFASAKSPAIFRITTKEGLPRFYVEGLREEDRENEAETIILPFTKVNKIEETSKWNGYTYYDVELEKEKLEPVKKEELEALRKECIDGYLEYMDQIEEYIRVEDRIKMLTSMFSESYTTQEDKKYIMQDKELEYKKAYEIKDNLTIFKEKLLRLMKGLCKEKEIEIDLEKEEIAKAEAEKRKKEEEELRIQIEKHQKEIEEMLEVMSPNLNDHIKKLQNQSEAYQMLANNLEIDYTNSVTKNLQQNSEEIEEQIESISEKAKMERELTTQSLDDLVKDRRTLENIERLIEKFPELINLHDKQSHQQIRASVNAKAQPMITKFKLEKLENQRRQIESSKDTIFQKLRGKNKWKEAAFKNVDAKEMLVKQEVRNPNNSTRIVVQNIFDAIYEAGLQHNPPQELIRYACIIRKNIKSVGEIPEQTLIYNAKSKIETSYPILPEDLKSRKFKKEEINRLDRSTEEIREKVMELRNTKNERGIDSCQENAISILEYDTKKTINIIQEKKREKVSTYGNR